MIAVVRMLGFRSGLSGFMIFFGSAVDVAVYMWNFDVGFISNV